jgi:hypothetical protein
LKKSTALRQSCSLLLGFITSVPNPQTVNFISPFFVSYKLQLVTCLCLL